MSGNLLRNEFHLFACALVFLTRVPLRLDRFSDEDLAGSCAYFPAVGFLVGAFAACVFVLAAEVWEPSIAVLLAVASAVVLTGAFHEDGLADTADGLGGGWSVERKLEIMKDSRIGTYGACALLLALMLKVTALAAIDPEMVASTLIVAHCLGRWTILPMLRCLPYVSGETGSGAGLAAGVTLRRASLATTFAILVAIVGLPQLIPGLLLGIVVVVAAATQFFRRQLGGITGDTLGALNQVVETGVYLWAAALF